MFEFLDICSNDLYGELFTKALSKLIEVIDFSWNWGQFENRQFSIPTITEKKCKIMHFEIILVKINASSSIDEVWQNVSTSLRSIKSTSNSYH